MLRAAKRAVGTVALVVSAAAGLIAPTQAAPVENSDAAPPGWMTYRNQRFGFSLSVPADVFVEGEARNKEQGSVWISHDRQARLLAVATRNETGETVQSYRAFRIQNSYKGAAFDYMPHRDNWFVLSGVQGGQVFYERILFACDGRYIYGWQMRYPIARKRFYDRLVEQVHRGYEPGRGEDGNCGP